MPLIVTIFHSNTGKIGAFFVCKTGKARRAVNAILQTTNHADLISASMHRTSVLHTEITLHLHEENRLWVSSRSHRVIRPNSTLSRLAKNACSSQTVQPKSHTSRQILLKTNQDFLLRVRLLKPASPQLWPSRPHFRASFAPAFPALRSLV